MASADNLAASTIKEKPNLTCFDDDSLPNIPSKAEHCSDLRCECLSISSQSTDTEESELRGTYSEELQPAEAHEPQPEGREDSLSGHVREEELHENAFTRLELDSEDTVACDVATSGNETSTTRTRCLSLGSHDFPIHSGFSTLSFPVGRRSSVSLPSNTLNLVSSSLHSEQLPSEPRVLPSNASHSLPTPGDTGSRYVPLGITGSSSTTAVSHVGDSGWRRLSLAQNSYRWKNSRRVCHHRLNFAQDGPPCYLCSLSDLPPKYRTIENVGLGKVKRIAMAFVQGLATSHVPGRRRSCPTPAESLGGTQPFTISSGKSTWHNSQDSTGDSQVPTSGTPNTLPASDTDTGNYRRTQHDDNAHELSCQRPSSSMSSSEATHTDGGDPLYSTPGCSRDCGGSVVTEPPPYTPPTPGSLVSRSTHEILQLERESDQATGHDQGAFIRNTQCNLVYSILLASATTVLVMGYDQPLVILACVILFLAVFIFLPIIWCIEGFLHLKTERSRRNTVHPQFQNNFIFPVIR
ncbi:uncharacterized protein [Panulirus ornatus]|uniref:uncharacterized protein n=1 Tax=Panulirus ornatus TaxID=150431 RepID=UPI003A8608DD